MRLRRPFERATGDQLVPEAVDGIWFRDDFVTKLDSAFGVTAGGVNTATTDAGVNHPTCVNQQVTAVGDAARILTENASNAMQMSASGEFYVEACVAIPVLSDGVNNIVVRAGFGDNAGAGDFTDGVYFEYDLATHGHGRWMLCAANNAVRTKTDTGIAAITGFQVIRASLTADSTSLTGMVSGVPCAAAVTTNIPTARSSGPELMSVKQLGAGLLFTSWDWWEFRKLFFATRNAIA